MVVGIFEESQSGGRLDAGCANRDEYRALPQRLLLRLEEPLGDRRLVLGGGDPIPSATPIRDASGSAVPPSEWELHDAPRQ